MGQHKIARGAPWYECVTQQPNGCLTWDGHRNPAGYGRWRQQLAHRLVYEIEVGPIPDGLVIDHLCREPACVNPQHLEPVTQLVNLHRGVGTATQTHCVHGHPFDETNTWIERRKGGGVARVCAECKRRRTRERYARRGQAVAA